MTSAQKSLLNILSERGFTETDIFHLCTIVSKSVNPGTFIQKVAKVKFNKDVPKTDLRKTIEERAHEFAMSLAVYEQKYGRPFLQRFYNHWKEPTQGKTKMKWETQKTWDLAGRLRTFEELSERWGYSKKEEKPSVNVSDIIDAQTNKIMNQI